MGRWYPWVCSFASLTPRPLWGFKMNFIPHGWLRGSISMARCFLCHRVLIAYLLDICQNDCHLKIPYSISVACGSFYFSDSSCLSPPNSLHPVLLAITCSLALNLSFSSFSFLESLYLQPHCLDWWGWGESWISPFDLLILCGCLLVSCVSASVACAWCQSWEVVDGVCLLRCGCFLGVLELATVPFQQFIKSRMNPTKGFVIYRKNSKSCFFLYLLDSVFHKMKFPPSPAWAISFLTDILAISLKWICCNTWLSCHDVLWSTALELFSLKRKIIKVEGKKEWR